MKRKILWIILIILILLFIFVNVVYIYNKINGNSNQENVFTTSLLDKQKQRDIEIDKIKKDKKYTFDNPKVINNPYYVSPLTSIIIFNTKEETPIKVKINDQEEISYSSTKEHVIPILGLKPGIDNKIVISDGNNTNEVIIKTDEYNVSSELIKENNDNNIMLVSYYQKIEGYNNKMDLIWYLDGNYGGKIVKLNNGHFLIGETINNSTTYHKILEMDYLGKIYTCYELDKNYSTDMTLKDKNLLYVTEDRMNIIELNLATNEIVRQINVSSLIGNNEFLINNIYYYNNSIIVNLGNQIISLDNNTLEIKYKSSFENDMISDVTLINDKIALFQTGYNNEIINDCNLINNIKSSISLYNSELQLDEQLLLPYFSYKQGSIINDDGKNYILIGNEFYDNNLCKIQDEAEFRSRILVYQDNEIIFNGTISNLYQYLNVENFNDIKDVNTTNYKLFNNQNSYIEIEIGDIKEKINNAMESAYNYEIDSSFFTFNGIMRDDDEAYILFVVNNKAYKYVIKEKNKDVNNIINISNLKGKADIYLVMNDYYYILGKGLNL